jgi:hypothetical protein
VSDLTATKESKVITCHTADLGIRIEFHCLNRSALTDFNDVSQSLVHGTRWQPRMIKPSCVMISIMIRCLKHELMTSLETNEPQRIAFEQYGSARFTRVVNEKFV